MSIKNRVVAVGLAVAAGAAAADSGVDIAPITAAGASVAAIGVAVFAVHVGMKMYKWIRGAL